MLLERQADPKLPYSERFSVDYCINTSIEQCKKQMGRDASDSVFQHLASTNAACKKKKGVHGLHWLLASLRGLFGFGAREGARNEPSEVENIHVGLAGKSSEHIMTGMWFPC